MKALAAILEKLNSPLIVDEVEIPLLQTGQVLVRVYSSGICGTQLSEVAGTKGEDRFIPHLLGHEGAGLVEAIGEGVTYVHVGDKVVLHWRCGAGINAGYPKYKWGDKIVGGGAVTTFNKYAVVSENRLTPFFFDVSYDIAALMGCAITTGLGIVENDAQLKIGQSIAVIGCGGVGLSVIQGAVLRGAYPIIAIDNKEEKLTIAKTFGATHFITNHRREEIKKISDNHGVDIFVDCTGDIESIENAYALTAVGGKMIMAGVPKHGQSLTLPNISKAFTGKQLIASQGGQCNPNKDIGRYLRLYREGKLDLQSLITHRFPLEQINEALDIVRSGIAGRCIVYMD